MAYYEKPKNTDDLRWLMGEAYYYNYMGRDTDAHHLLRLVAQNLHVIKGNKNDEADTPSKKKGTESHVAEDFYYTKFGYS